MPAPKFAMTRVRNGAGLQQLGVEAVGDRRHQRIEFAQGAHQRFAIERQVVRVGGDLVTAAQTFVYRFGQAARDQESGALHGTPGTDARMERSISPMADTPVSAMPMRISAREHLEHLRYAPFTARRQRECPGAA